jgi:hypothetical protein
MWQNVAGSQNKMRLEHHKFCTFTKISVQNIVPLVSRACEYDASN